MPLIDIREASNSGKVLRRRLKDQLELGLGFVELSKLHQRAAERYAGRQVTGVSFEAGTGDLHSILEITGPAVFLSELRERDRRRVLLDPAPKRLYAGLTIHPMIMA